MTEEQEDSANDSQKPDKGDQNDSLFERFVVEVIDEAYKARNDEQAAYKRDFKGAFGFFGRWHIGRRIWWRHCMRDEGERPQVEAPLGVAQKKTQGCEAGLCAREGRTKVPPLHWRLGLFEASQGADVDF